MCNYRVRQLTHGNLLFHKNSTSFFLSVFPDFQQRQWYFKITDSASSDTRKPSKTWPSVGAAPGGRELLLASHQNYF